MRHALDQEKKINEKRRLTAIERPIVTGERERGKGRQREDGGEREKG